jgi:hypothetical protein
VTVCVISSIETSRIGGEMKGEDYIAEERAAVTGIQLARPPPHRSWGASYSPRPMAGGLGTVSGPANQCVDEAVRLVIERSPRAV